MANTRKLEVIISGDTKGISSAFGKVDREAGGLGSKLASFGKAAAVGFAAAGAGAVVLGKSFVDAAIESQKVTKQTEAVLKSMGDSAGLNAKQIANLAEKQSMLSGVDDELIQSGQNVLLTFGKVRNEVGKGNDIFTRASQSALDMSVALGTDLKGANIQLGKALNDPIKGITALGRAGVSFTEQQKDQIKAMVAAGDTLGAQKIILGEMEKQFGGSAAAQATAGEKLKVIWGNLQEELGAKLLPVVEKVATFLAEKLPGALDAVGGVFEKILRPIGDLSARWQQVVTGFQIGSADFAADADGIGATLLKLGEGFRSVVDWVQANWPKIQQTVSQVMETIGSIVSGAVTVITVLWENFGNNILEFVQRVWPNIQQVIGGALEIIQGVVKTITSLIQGDWSGVWEGIKQIVSGAWSAIQGIIKAALEAIRGIVGIALEIVGSVIKGAWDGIVGYFKGIPGKIGDAFSTLAEVITAPYRIAFRAIKKLWNDTVGGFGFSLPSWIPGLGGKSFKIPEMHTGGIVPGGPRNETLRLLQGGEGVFTADQMAALGGRLAMSGGSSGPTTVVVQLGEREIGRFVIDELTALGKSDGIQYLNAG